MNDNYGKDERINNSENSYTEKSKAEIILDQINADRKKSDQMSRKPDAEEQHRQGGNRVSDQGGSKHAAK